MKPTSIQSSPSNQSSINVSAASTPPRAHHSSKSSAVKNPSRPLPVLGAHIRVNRDKKTWQIPNTNSKVLILGDSNIAKAKNLPQAGKSVELHSFPGAKICHFIKMANEHRTTQGSPEVIILSVGINNRDNSTSTHKAQIKSLLQGYSKKFPSSQIYFPQINVPSGLTRAQKRSLEALNSSANELLRTFTNCHSISKLPDQAFEISRTDPYKIHWTTQTANNFMSHWISNLN